MCTTADCTVPLCGLSGLSGLSKLMVLSVLSSCSVGSSWPISPQRAYSVLSMLSMLRASSAKSACSASSSCSAGSASLSCSACSSSPTSLQHAQRALQAQEAQEAHSELSELSRLRLACSSYLYHAQRVEHDEPNPEPRTVFGALAKCRGVAGCVIDSRLDRFTKLSSQTCAVSGPARGSSAGHFWFVPWPSTGRRTCLECLPHGGARCFLLRQICLLAGRGNKLGKFAFGDRTIPIHARTLGPDEHKPERDGRVLHNEDAEHNEHA